MRTLVTIGTLITLLGAGVAAHLLSEFPWAIAFLYGSLVVVTGSTVINPLLRQVKVDRQDCLQVAPAEKPLQADDRLIYLLYDPKPKLLKLLSGFSQSRLTLESLPEVEHISVVDSADTGSADAANELLDQEPLQESDRSDSRRNSD